MGGERLFNSKCDFIVVLLILSQMFMNLHIYVDFLMTMSCIRAHFYLI